MPDLRILPTADSYFIRSYVKLFALVMLAVILLLVVGDLSQRTDEYVEFSQESGKALPVVILMVVQYYLAFAPSLVLQHMLPLTMLLAGALVITGAALHNEYTVLRSSGVSLQRSLLPILLVSFFLSSCFQWSRDWYLPTLLRTAHRVESAVRPKSTKVVSLFLPDNDEIHSISMGHFDFTEGRYVARHLRIEKRKANAFFHDNDSFDTYTAWQAVLQPRTDLADRVEGDERELQWKSEEGGRREIYTHTKQAGLDYYTVYEEKWTAPMPTYVTPAMLERRVLGEAVMTWSDLRRLSSEELDVMVELHRRRSEPWAHAVLLLCGLTAVLAMSKRGAPNYVVNIVIAIMAAGFWYAFRAATLGLGEDQTLSPWLAAWLPILLAGVGGGYTAMRLEY